MLPVMLDLARLPAILIGDGAAAEKRLRLLDEAGAAKLAIFAERPGAALALTAGDRLHRRLPRAEETAAARVVFVADRNAPYVEEIAAQARAAGAFLHIEDDPARSDLHMTAVLRRGELTIAVSTGGASPGLAVRIKRHLAHLFGPEWGERVAAIARLRRQWRAEGAGIDALAARTEQWIDGRDWLSQPKDLPPAEPAPKRAAARF
jgi:precorrin-2 dehydrogenase / sirohydrochlorin ferrochelatase